MAQKSVVMKNALPPMLASQNSWCNNHVPSFGFRAEEGLMNRITASAFEISWSTCGKESHKQILKYKMRAGTTEMCSRSGDCKNKWMPKSRGWENKLAVVTKAFLEEVMPEMAFKKRRNFFLAQRMLKQVTNTHMHGNGFIQPSFPQESLLVA